MGSTTILGRVALATGLLVATALCGCESTHRGGDPTTPAGAAPYRGTAPPKPGNTAEPKAAQDLRIAPDAGARAANTAAP